MFAEQKKDYLSPQSYVIELSPESIICESTTMNVGMEEFNSSPYDWTL